MKQTFLRTCALTIGLALGAAVSVPSVAAPSASSGMAATPSYLLTPAINGPTLGHAFAGFTFAGAANASESEPTNPCDPITPQNWYSCGGGSRG